MPRSWGTWDIDPDVKGIVGWVATAITIGLFLSPVPTFLKIVREKSTLDFSYFPYLMTFLNCLLWVCYFIVNTGQTAPLSTNIVGAALSFIYLNLFIFFYQGATPGSTKVEQAKIIAYALGGAGTAAILTALLIHFNHDDYAASMSSASFYLGLLAAFFNIAMYASPLSVIRLVITTKSVEFMPLPLSVMTFMVSSIWLFFGLYVGDVWITTPNVLGVILGAAQLIIWTIYRNGPTHARDDDHGSSEYASIRDP
eukprot:gnl/Spiro4/13645_TR7270_c0_g1_i1.p1 gnl/Spiro4/13645_TR7270_c0_g1~~gnl/Spiro4/13645_TR7270_c0_g1_i1.p1  ORF type:complete len:254 (+),score=68.73 gnl/Spiro4/13645_TR7270_c0_g1_i1:47-808(+)